jgi:hypothetical protein
LVRAASFHHLDVLLRLQVFGMPMHVVLELGGIGCIMIAVVIRLMRDKDRRSIVSK